MVRSKRETERRSPRQFMLRCSRKIPIKFLYLCSPVRLEPLCAPAPYSGPGGRKTLSLPDTHEVPSFRTAPFGLSGLDQFKGTRIMLDLILIGTAVVFFGLCFAYTRACDRL